jgi:hypothetical protein
MSFIESVSVDMNMVVHFGRNTTFHYTSDLNPTDKPTEFSIPSFFRLIKATGAEMVQELMLTCQRNFLMS